VLSKQNSFDSTQRITATNLANEMIERMRANPTSLLDYVSTNGMRTIGNSSIQSEPTPVCDSSNNCSAQDLAEHDLWEFEQAIDGATETNSDGNNTGGLDSPTACISGPTDGSAGVYTIAIAWRGRLATSNPTINTCGENAAINSVNLYGSNNEYRRIVVFQNYIDNQ
jgi:type IV pilus assembly protein PilV